MIELMKAKLSFSQSEIQDGDVICFQVDLPEKEYVLHPFSKYLANSRRINDLESQGLYSNPVQFYDFLQNRVMIVFKPRYDDQGDDEFHLVFSKKQNYDVVR